MKEVSRTQWFWGWFFLGILAGALIFGGLLGCAGISRPRNETELFPDRKGDSRTLFCFSGVPATNLQFQDEAGKILFEEWGWAGSTEYVRLNGRFSMKCYAYPLRPGRYRLKDWPFYYRFFILDGRQRRDLPINDNWIAIPDNPLAYYDPEFERHFAARFNVDTGNVPLYQPGAISAPMVDVYATGIAEDVVRYIFGLFGVQFGR